MHETALRLLGARAELLPEAPAARGVGDWLDGYLFALSGPIYAGTNEIQRNVIAERILGMPRD
jgi:alkylation response protein AidB-like acyl-CoA dehydrogenase